MGCATPLSSPIFSTWVVAPSFGKSPLRDGPAFSTAHRGAACAPASAVDGWRNGTGVRWGAPVGRRSWRFGSPGSAGRGADGHFDACAASTEARAPADTNRAAAAAALCPHTMIRC